MKPATTRWRPALVITTAKVKISSNKLLTNIQLGKKKYVSGVMDGESFSNFIIFESPIKKKKKEKCMLTYTYVHLCIYMKIYTKNKINLMHSRQSNV